MSATLRAVLWDVDGTIAETERDGHRVAFNRAFERFGLPWRWDVETYGDLLRIAGGEERLRYDLQRRSAATASSADVAARARALHACKNDFYAAMVASSDIGLRPGVPRLMRACADAGVLQAIATTTSRANVAALLTSAYGEGWADRFAAVVCAEDAPRKKPDPEVYRLALERLGVGARESIAIEDSPNGVDAARAASIAVVVARSIYFRQSAFDGAAAICDDLDSPLRWHGGGAARADLDSLRRVLADATPVA